MPRSGISRADAALIAACAAHGVHVSPYQLERWRAAGILERNHRRGLGRGRGSTATIPDGVLPRVLALAKFARQGKPSPWTDPLVRFALGQSSPEEVVRAEFRAEIDSLSTMLAVDAGAGDEADDQRFAAADRLARRIGALPDLRALVALAQGLPVEDTTGGGSRTARTVLQLLAGGLEAVSTEDLVRAFVEMIGPEDDVESLVADLHARERAGEVTLPDPRSQLFPSLSDYRHQVATVALPVLQRAASVTLQANMYATMIALSTIIDPHGFDDLLADHICRTYGRFGGIPRTRQRFRVMIVFNTMTGLQRGEEWLASAEAFAQRALHRLATRATGHDNIPADAGLPQ
jgi:hypothetical protein